MNAVAIRQFLKSLEAAIPPPQNCHHALTYAQFGSDSLGWQDRLALQVNAGGEFYCFFVDNEDFRDVEKTAAYIKSQLNKTSAQLGKALGQYI